MWKTLILCIIGTLIVSLVSAENNGKAKKPRAELEIDVLKSVDCAEDHKVQLGHVLNFHYKMTVVGHPDITESSYENSNEKGVVFYLSKGMAIKGFLKGLPGMCVGEIRKLTIPPHLGYGSKKHGDIPGGSTLVYEVEVLNFKEADDVIKRFSLADLNEDGVLDITEMEDVMDLAIKEGKLPVPDQPGFKEAMLNQLFLHADKNKDGGISTEEFRILLNIQSKKPKQEL